MIHSLKNPVLTHRASSIEKAILTRWRAALKPLGPFTPALASGPILKGGVFWPFHVTGPGPCLFGTQFRALGEPPMNRIANLKDLKKGSSLNFDYNGQKALLIRFSEKDVFAYIATCPHEGGTIEWDDDIKKILCECHLSLFNVADGSVYRHSFLFKLKEGLTKVELRLDENGNIFAV
jgi:nitrite reductase/ring-hydroxylating ferredoxin subunit